MRLVLFDIDGTLLIGHGAGARALTRAGRALCGPGFSLEGITISGGLDSVIYESAATALGIAVPELLHDAFRERYLVELEAELRAATPRPQLLPGVRELLQSLAALDHVSVGLLTGNYERAVPLKFRAVGLEHPFCGGAFGDVPMERHALLPVALDRLHLRHGQRFDSRDVIIVGDTPRDVECAVRNGCRCLAVATGAYACDALAAAGADRVVPDLRDAAALLGWLR